MYWLACVIMVKLTAMSTIISYWSSRLGQHVIGEHGENRQKRPYRSGQNVIKNRSHNECWCQWFVLWCVADRQEFLLTCYYPQPQLASFFYPISTYTESFQYFVMQNYGKVKNVEEFAHLGGYTVTTFRRLFRNLYGVPVYEWILDKKREGILDDLQHTKESKP